LSTNYYYPKRYRANRDSRNFAVMTLAVDV
jgi:hypothetical protein